MENFNALKSIEAKIERDAIYLIASIFVISLGMVIPSDVIIGKFQAGIFLSGFLVMTGVVFFALLFIDILVTTSHFHDWHKAQISAYRLKMNLPLPRHEKQNIPPPELIEPEPKQPITILNEQRHSSNGFTWTIENHPDRPALLFIEYVFKSKDESGLIPTERDLAKAGKDNGAWTSTQSNHWLDIFDHVKITTKVYETVNGNARRCLMRGLTLNEIREKFGYPAVSL